MLLRVTARLSKRSEKNARCLYAVKALRKNAHYLCAACAILKNAFTPAPRGGKIRRAAPKTLPQ